MGGGEGSTAREALRHRSVEEVVMCDIDEVSLPPSDPVDPFLAPFFVFFLLPGSGRMTGFNPFQKKVIAERVLWPGAGSCEFLQEASHCQC
jgi:hypothetical protein